MRYNFQALSSLFISASQIMITPPPSMSTISMVEGSLHRSSSRPSSSSVSSAAAHRILLNERDETATTVIDIILNSEIAKKFNSEMKAIQNQNNQPSSSSSSIFSQPQQPPCTSPSATWLREQTSRVSQDDLENFFDWYLHVLPFAYKLFVEEGNGSSNDDLQDDEDEEYFGLHGEYTDEIKLIHRRARDFWTDSSSSSTSSSSSSSGSVLLQDIALYGAHGSSLANRENLIQTLELLFDESYDEHYSVHDHATDIQELIERLPGKYDFPLLSFNAFATEASSSASLSSSSGVDGDAENGSTGGASIIIGDGYFQFQKSLGKESEGPEYAHTHEFSHHLQFVLGIEEEEDANDASDSDSNQNDQTDSTNNSPSLVQFAQKQELMADAFSAYFLAHNYGGDMTDDEITNVQTVAYSVGDCETSNEEYHHGTPSQRRCATRWGASLADNHNEEDYTKSLSLKEVERRFEVWYGRLDEMDEFCAYPTSSSFSSLPSSASAESSSAALSAASVTAFVATASTMLSISWSMSILF